MKSEHMNQILKPTFLIITVLSLYWLSVQFAVALSTISVLILLGIIINKNFNINLIDKVVSYFCESFLVILISPLLIISQIKKLFSLLQAQLGVSPVKFLLAMLIIAAFLFAPIVLSESLNSLLWYSIIALFSLVISMFDSENHFENTSNNSFFLGFIVTVSLVISGLVPNFITIASLILFNIGALIINTEVTTKIIESFIGSQEIRSDKNADLTHLLSEASNIIYQAKVPLIN
jgi:hypothetical protein